MRRMIFVCVLIGLVLCLTAAQAAPAVRDVRTQMGEDFVAYPQLEGMADEAIQQKINDDVVLSSGVTNHLVTLATLGDSPWGLQVDYEVTMLDGGVFSAVMSAKGKMPNGREGQAYAALSYDLRTGERLALDALFADVDAAVDAMEQIAQSSLAEELSSHMENSALTPLPVDSFTLDADGITFWYPSDQFKLLSGYSGACQFYYSELEGLLRTDKDALLTRLGVLEPAYTAKEAAKRIQAAVEEGELVHVPVKLGDDMTAVVARYRLTRTPDAFPGGRYFVLEAPAFRSVLVISDAIQSAYDGSVVEGIQLRRGSLYGLTVGATARGDWQRVLGDAHETITLTESMAYDYGLPAGQCDLYRYGAHELRLYADQSGTLCAIQLGK